jgi:hypothetical protein
LFDQNPGLNRISLGGIDWFIGGMAGADLLSTNLHESVWKQQIFVHQVHQGTPRRRRVERR